jgi:hypothetical protein
LRLVEDQPIELLLRIGGAGPPGMQRYAIMRGGLPPARVPIRHGLSGPLGGVTDMTLGAGIRRAERNRQVGARHPHTVITPGVDDHVILGGHVAVDALRAGAPGLVMMVPGDIEFRRHVALRTESVPFGTQLGAVRVVAVRAGDSGGMHPALQERAVFVDLAVDLLVGVIETGPEQRRQIEVEIGRARHCTLGDHSAARVTGGALGTFVVPSLVPPGPMQRVVGLELLTRVEMEPALAALLFRAAIPGDAERLIASHGKGDQILRSGYTPKV